MMTLATMMPLAMMTPATLMTQTNNFTRIDFVLRGEFVTATHFSTSFAPTSFAPTSFALTTFARFITTTRRTFNQVFKEFHIIYYSKLFSKVEISFLISRLSTELSIFFNKVCKAASFFF